MASLTLAFALGALRRLDDPAAAVADAREWSAHVVIVADDPIVAADFARRRRLRPDFLPSAGKRATLEELLGTGTDRHVLVGAGDEDRDLAAAAGWEYRPVGEAAAKAGWRLAAGERSWHGRIAARLSGLLARLRGSRRGNY